MHRVNIWICQFENEIWAVVVHIFIEYLPFSYSFLSSFERSQSGWLALRHLQSYFFEMNSIFCSSTVSGSFLHLKRTLGNLFISMCFREASILQETLDSKSCCYLFSRFLLYVLHIHIVCFQVSVLCISRNEEGAASFFCCVYNIRSVCYQFNLS